MWVNHEPTVITYKRRCYQYRDIENNCDAACKLVEANKDETS